MKHLYVIASLSLLHHMTYWGLGILALFCENNGYDSSWGSPLVSIFDLLSLPLSSFTASIAMWDPITFYLMMSANSIIWGFAMYGYMQMVRGVILVGGKLLRS